MKTLVYTDVDLSDKTTYRIGGPACYYAQPSGVDDIKECLAWALGRGAPVVVLGKGSNVLISDVGWPGLVIDAGARFDRISWDGPWALCCCGAQLGKLLREMLDKGLKGIEHCAGIPGSVGGALVMNAGAYGHTVTECVTSVDYYDFGEKLVKTMPAEGLMAGYRRTVFSTNRAIVLLCCFHFQPDPSGAAQETFRECIAKRKEKHPLDLPNCGSIFKNIPGQSTAASLIEKSGLKGFRFGGAEVSLKHANFIVNRGSATAAHVRHCIVHIQKTVYEKQGVVLEPEVVFVGEFEEPLFKP
jgi:UDP-N-acetylmuramate dehydrogenase